MPLTVLSDDQVNSILENLTLSELEEFQNVMSSALHEFSTNPSGSETESYQQPHRIGTFHPVSKTTTLYMPCAGPEGMGCKVVSLTTCDVTQDPNVKPIPPTGVVNLFSPDGQPIGLLQASTLTAFRTALSSTSLLTRRNHVRTLTVFGSGAQAYWHIRLALMLRGRTIRTVNVINRRFSPSLASILKALSTTPHEVKQREGWADAKFSALTPTFHDYERLLAENLVDADVIYCCTPSREDLFDGKVLTSHDGRKKGRLIVAVGSFTPEMREIPEEILLQATKRHNKPHRHFHKHADEGGVIIVDTLEGVLKEAGEIIAAKISSDKLVELGELVMLHRLAVEESETESLASDTTTTTEESESIATDGDDHSETKSGFHLPFRKLSTEKRNKEESRLAKWLRDGTVVYKCVGLGLMDLVIGNHVVKVARDKNVGTLIPDF